MRFWSINIFTLLTMAAVGCFAPGCGTVHPRGLYQSFGEANPQLDEAVLKAFKERKTTQVPANEVRIMVDTFPEGIAVKGDVMRVKKGFHHKIIGKFAVKPQMVWATFGDYTTPWRKGYCYWQVPLVILTLGTWSIFVPLYYPCWAGPVRGPEAILNYVRILAKAAGGDLAIVTYIGKGKNVSGAAGTIIRLDPRRPPGEEQEPPDEPEEANQDTI